MNLHHRISMLERRRPPVIAWEGPLIIVRSRSDNPRIPRGVTVRVARITRLDPDGNEVTWDLPLPAEEVRV